MERDNSRTYGGKADRVKVWSMKEDNGMAIKKFRNMKVYNVRRYEDYKDTPTIIMKGEWLKEAGFDIGSLIQVECTDGKLIITPRVEVDYQADVNKHAISRVAENSNKYGKKRGK